MWGSDGVTIRQYLIRSVNVLNLVLLAAAVVVFYYLLDPILQEPAAVAIPPAKEESAPPAVPARGIEGQPLTSADYAVIGDKNLFHPDRVIPPEKKTETAKEKVKPDIVLHGTMITDQMKLAYIEDKKAPATSPGRGTRQSTLKEGDQIGGYKLIQITDKMIVLTNGSEQMTLYLDELKERKTETTMTAKPGIATQPMATQPPLRTVTPQPRPQTEKTTSSSAMPSRRVTQPVRTGGGNASLAEVLPPPPTIPLLPVPPPVMPRP